MQDSGEPFGLWRVEFSRGFGFRRKKSPLLALDNTNLTVYFQKINLQQAITSFPETNIGGGGGVNLILPHSGSQKRQNWDEVK